MKTQRVSCNVSHKLLKRTLQRNCAVVLNALSSKYYIQDRIPNSYNLPYKLVKDKELTEQEVVKFVKSLVPHYPRLLKSLEKQSKIELQRNQIKVLEL